MSNRNPCFSIVGLSIFILLILFLPPICIGIPVDPDVLVKKAIARLKVGDVVSDAQNYVRNVKDGPIVPPSHSQPLSPLLHQSIVEPGHTFKCLVVTDSQ